MNNTFDIIIIGSGITGSLIARYLSKYELKVLVVEKETDVGMCPSSANSAIIHSGCDPKPGTVKAKLNVEGNSLWHSLAPELGIRYKKTGSYVVSVGKEESSRLPELLERARSNNVESEIIGPEEMKEREPLINPGVSGALWCPSAAVLDPFGAVLAAAENAVVNGVTFLFETEFMDFITENSKITGIKTNRGDFYCRWAVNAAGLFSDEVAHKAGIRNDFRIIPRRGEYLIFDPARFIINNVLFQMPSEISKGVLVSTTTHGNVMIGPNAVNARDKYDTGTTKQGMEEILTGARRLIPSVDARDTIAQFAGLRATGSGDRDFIIESPVPGFISLCGIDSPGFASAPAIALTVVSLLEQNGEKLIARSGWKPGRKPFPHFHLMTNKEKAALVKKNPAYGRIVCRCEEVTEGELIDALRSPVPAKTYDGIKRRTWLGTGRCQGSFDYPRVIEILARELNIPVEQVSKKGKGSEIVFRKTKDMPDTGHRKE